MLHNAILFPTSLIDASIFEHCAAKLDIRFSLRRDGDAEKLAAEQRSACSNCRSGGHGEALDWPVILAPAVPSTNHRSKAPRLAHSDLNLLEMPWSSELAAAAWPPVMAGKAFYSERFYPIDRQWHANSCIVTLVFCPSRAAPAPPPLVP